MRNAAYFIASQNGAGGGVLHAVLRSARDAWRAWTNRRQVARLTELDDHMLSDLGLTRLDVNHALHLPFGSDPGRELQFRASRNIRRGWRA